MAKVKNTGQQPRGFWDEDGSNIVVLPGEEAEFNMSEADYKKNQELLEAEGDPPPFELSGGAGGVKKTVAQKREAPQHRGTTSRRDRDDEK